MQEENQDLCSIYCFPLQVDLNIDCIHWLKKFFMYYDLKLPYLCPDETVPSSTVLGVGFIAK